MVSAAKVQPLHIRQDVSEFLRHGIQGGLQRVGILLAEGVEMQSVQQLHQRWRHVRIPLGAGGSQTAARRTGVVNLMTFLGGTFRIDA